MTETNENKRLLSWTGERCVPWADEVNVVHEHMHRYLFTRELAAGKDALDLGSGEGYGSSILAESASSVVGIEIDSLAVEHSRLNYPRPNLNFEEGSVLDLSRFGDDSFDLAVCFEVIEHVEDHEALLQGVSRVLRPGGVFVVSTPDREVYNQELGHVNPYHLKEMSLEEFRALLKTSFSSVEMYGQRALSGSVLRKLDGDSGPLPRSDLAVRKDGEKWTVQPAPALKYLVAIASNDKIPALPGESLLYEEGASGGSAESLRQRHPILGEAVLVGRSVVEAARRRAALFLRERNRRKQV